jgi:hypothetical protein
MVTASSKYDRLVRVSLDIVHKDEHDAYQVQTCEISVSIKIFRKLKNFVKRNEICSLLEGDLLRHIVTLKMISNYALSMNSSLIHNENGWALLTILPIEASDWDRKTYHDATVVVFIDGNNIDYKTKLLDEVPRAKVIFKTYDEYIRSYLTARKAKKLTSFISFTDNGNLPNINKTEMVEQSFKLNEEAASLIMKNNYDYKELFRCFSNGAKWFGVRVNGKLVSVCFVYQNYKNIWEIGGIYTENEYRRQGLAKLHVTAALSYLKQKGYIIRYQVREGNTASIQLAKSNGLSEFLRLDHYLYSVNE